MSEIAQRLFPELDAGKIPAATTEMNRPPASAGVAAGKAEPDLRPLYLRRHGISAGTRVEWVKPAPPKNRPVSRDAEVQELLNAAAAGNSRAMTILGLLHHKGERVPQDLIAAHDWYLKGAAGGDGDAIVNLGILYRDGFIGRKEEKLAYLLFVAAYRSGGGTEQSRARARGNLEGLMQQISKPEIHEALSYTWPYVLQVLASHGTDWSIKPEVLPTKERPRIRDNNWWQESERVAMTFSSPPPWDKVYN